MIELDLLSAFLIGLLGSGHCIGMCGGISGVLSSAIKEKSNKHKFMLIFSYNFGRIFIYGFIGFLVAYSGSIANHRLGISLLYLQFISAIFIILLGLYIGQWFSGLKYIESLGKGIWKLLSPLTKHLIPVNNSLKALLLGALWGWLPCGLVYSTLTWALAVADPLRGASIMLFFGLGTLPALISIAWGVKLFTQIVKHAYFRNITALLLILYGVYAIFIAFQTII